MPVTIPYEPTEGIDWAAVPGDAAPSPWTGDFEDKTLRDELRRFVYRDSFTLACALVYALGTAGFFATTASRYSDTLRDPIVIVFYAVWLPTFFVLLIIEFALQCVRGGDPAAHTVTVAKVRQGMAIVACACCGFLFSQHYINVTANCGTATLEELNHANATVRAAARAIRQEHCVDAIDIVTIGGIVFGAGNLRVYPHFAVPLIILAVFWTFVGRAFTGDDDPESWRTLVVQLIVHIAVACVAAPLAILRHRGTVAAFHENVQQHRVAALTAAEQRHVDEALQYTLPPSVLRRVAEASAAGRPLSEVTIVDSVASASIMFADMVQFTAWSASRASQDVAAALQTIVSEADAAAAALGITKIKTVGDAYWAAAGIPEISAAHADQLTTFALQFQSIVWDLNESHRDWADGDRMVEFRCGIASGPVTAVLLGTDKLSYEPCGATQTLAVRLEQAGVPQRVAVCAETARLLCAPDITLEETVQVAATAAMDGDAMGGEPLTFRLARWVDESTSGQHVSLRRSNSVSAASMASGSMSVSRNHLVLTDVLGHGSDDPLEETGEEQQQRRAFAAQRMMAARRKRGAFAKTAKMMAVKAADDASGTPKNDSFAGQNSSAVFEASMEEDVTAKAIEEEAKLAPRYPCVLLDFADTETELEFREFAVDQTRNTRLFTRGATIAFIAALFIAQAVERTKIPVILYGVTGVCAGGAMALTIFDVAPRLESLVHCTTPLLLLLTLIYSPEYSTVANEPAYVLTVTDLLVIPALLLPAVVRIGIFAALVLVSFILHDRESPLATAQLMLLLAGFGFACLIAVSSETQLRQQFRERRAARRARHALQEAKEQQVALLGTIVPPHAVSRLVAWMRGGMDPAHAVVDEYASAAVAFLRLRPNGTWGSGAGDSGVSWLRAAHVWADGALAKTAAVEKVKTIGDTAIVGGPFLRQTGAATARKNAADAAAEEAAPRRRHSVAANEEDEQLRIAAVLGDILFVANSIAAASDRDVGVDLGAHVGPMVGLVLGHQRLCYDVLGDAVNTASRILTATTELVGRSGLSLSQEALSILVSASAHSNSSGRRMSRSAEMTEPGAAEFSVAELHRRPELAVSVVGNAVDVAAKGKGTLRVHRVQVRVASEAYLPGAPDAGNN